MYGGSCLSQRKKEMVGVIAVIAIAIAIAIATVTAIAIATEDHIIWLLP